MAELKDLAMNFRLLVL